MYDDDLKALAVPLNKTGTLTATLSYSEIDQMTWDSDDTTDDYKFYMQMHLFQAENSLEKSVLPPVHISLEDLEIRNLFNFLQEIIRLEVKKRAIRKEEETTKHYVSNHSSK